METPFPPFDPDGKGSHDADNMPTRLRDISLRSIFPNLLTLLAICAGLTSIRFGIDGRIELAVGAIIFAGFLDGIDGRVARFLKSTSRFGAEMDSLADFLNFGVAPALLLYFTLLNEVQSLGWIVALIFVSCACMRLARFNAMLDGPEQPDWQNRFFVGVPAPAGALLVLLPLYVHLLGVDKSEWLAWCAACFTLFVAFLLVSNIPTFSGKEFSKKIRRDLVPPFMIFAVFFIAALISYPWKVLGICAILYLLFIPFSIRSHRQYAAKAE